MKLLFRQRFFSWFDSYDIYDEDGNTVYVVKGQLSWGHCLKIFDASGQELGTVKEKILTWLAGKGMQDRRFLWGLLTGSLYFCVLAALTLIVNHGFQDVGNHFFTTLMICSGAGMLGGMLS